MFDRERPSFEDSNNVTVQRCFFAYEYAKTFVTDKNIADIGCADGYGTSFLADFAASVTGVDYSAQTIALASEKHKHKSNLKFVQSSVPPLPFKNESLDVITSFQFIEHIKNRLDFIKEVYRVLKPGGVFLCTTPNIKMSIARNPFHVHEYTFSEMQEEMQKVFNNFELKGLQGNKTVNEYYEANAKWAKKILKIDPLGIHKLLPARWLVAPYNFLTTIMRNKLKDQNKATTQITTKDFFITTHQLDATWDIYVIAYK